MAKRMPEPLVLASSSPTRALLLAKAGIEVEIDFAAVDEAELKRESRARGEDAESCALRLAEAKARHVAPRHPGALVLGADQMLECDGHWFDKPRNLAAAREQLIALNGRRHALVTAAAIIRDGKALWHVVERAVLTMRHFSDAFLDRYLGVMGEQVLATVGAYELEGLGAQLMTQVEGDYFTILGLPLLPLMAFLRDEGILSR